MHVGFFKRDYALLRKRGTICLAFMWFIGLVSGAVIAFSADSSILSMMRLAAQSEVSIVGFITVSALPFLITAVAVYFSQPFLIYMLAFCKAFCCAYCGLMLIISFGTAGWLIRILIMFTDICTVSLLLWVWIRFLSGQRIKRLDAAVCLCVIVCIMGADYCFVSPYLAMLIH